MLYDLHVHTSASDGVFSPPEVLRRACQLGLAMLTDHDTLVAGGLVLLKVRKLDLELISN